MRYSDLVSKTTNLSLGRHTIYELWGNLIIIQNTGIRHPNMSERNEYRLLIVQDNRQLTPRHSDFFTDYLLKIETRPEFRLAITEACEVICNGADPLETADTKKLPEHFAVTDDDTWSLQNSMYQTGGLPTKLFLCGLQGLIRVQEINDPEMKAPEAYRQAFINLEKGTPLLEVVQKLRPQVMAGKRYFDSLYRKA